MKKLAYQIGGILLLSGLLVAPALAGVVFKSSMLCSGGASGTGSITKSGDVKIKVTGLEPDTTYGCIGFCACKVDLGFLDAVCETNTKGKLRIKVKGAAAGIPDCECPTIQVFLPGAG